MYFYLYFTQHTIFCFLFCFWKWLYSTDKSNMRALRWSYYPALNYFILLLLLCALLVGRG